MKRIVFIVSFFLGVTWSSVSVAAMRYKITTPGKPSPNTTFSCDTKPSGVTGCGGSFKNIYGTFSQGFMHNNQLLGGKVRYGTSGNPYSQAKWKLSVENCKSSLQPNLNTKITCSIFAETYDNDGNVISDQGPKKCTIKGVLPIYYVHMQLTHKGDKYSPPVIGFLECAINSPNLPHFGPGPVQK